MSVEGESSVKPPELKNDVVLRFVQDGENVLARMDRASVEVFSSLAEYAQAYGPYVDRLGRPSGKYFWQLPVEGTPFSFEQRALEVLALNDPYYAYEVKNLPEGFFIRTGINVAQFDAPGGARQVQFLAGSYALTASECLQLGILEGKVQS